MWCRSPALAGLFCVWSAGSRGGACWAVDAALRADWRPPVTQIGMPSHAIFFRGFIRRRKPVVWSTLRISCRGDVNLRFVDRRDDQLAHRHLDARAMPRDETGLFQPVAGKSHPRERGHFGSVFLWVEFAEVAPRLPNGYGAIGETVWCVMILFQPLLTPA